MKIRKEFINEDKMRWDLLIQIDHFPNLLNFVLNKFVDFGEVKRRKNCPCKGEDSWRQIGWENVVKVCALVFLQSVCSSFRRLC